MFFTKTSWSHRPFRSCFSWQQVETVVLKVFVKLIGCQELWPLYRFRDTNDFLSIFLCLWFYQQNFPPKVFKSCFVDKNLNEPPKGKVLKETSGSISISNIFDGFVWNDWCEATRYNTLSINISWWAFINICTYKPLNKLYPFVKKFYIQFYNFSICVQTFLSGVNCYSQPQTWIVSFETNIYFTA